MKKAKLIPILILILIVIGLGAFFFTGQGKKTDQAADTQKGQMVDKTKETKKDESFTGTLTDLLKMGKSVKCTGSFSDEESSMEMVVYTSGEKSYSETSFMAADGENMKTYSIFDSEWLYTWNDQGMATKMKVSDMEDLAKDLPAGEETEEAVESSEEYQNDFDYKCSAWIVDNGKFTPPSDLEFTDLTQVMQEISEYAGTGEDDETGDPMKAACAACAMLPIDEQAECKANLSCE